MSESATGKSAAPTTINDHRTLMDSVYRVQRHFYDVTRKFYLLGRDKVLKEMPVKQGESVLEVGCGTARNLLKLNKLVPGLKLYGLDASEEMLKTARKKVNNAGVDVKLVRVLAEELTPAGTFGRDEPFDHVFFSYALSMIPTWKESLEAASKSVKQGGAVWIVDFCDQKDLPGWFAKLLKWWLSLFHVAHKPELLEHLEELHRSGKGQVKIEFLYGRYCYIARYQPK